MQKSGSIAVNFIISLHSFCFANIIRVFSSVFNENKDVAQLTESANNFS